MIEYDSHAWRDHLFDVKGSMLREISYRVLLCVLWSAAVTGIYELQGGKGGFPAEAHALIGVALGMLLVFRTNASYDRFWEGRRQWGSIVNESRNLGRATAAYLDGDRALAAQLIAWARVFPFATMHLLRGTRELGPPAAGLPSSEVGEVLLSGHVPLAVARRMTGLVADARRRGLLPDYLAVALDQNVQLLVDYMGACERIMRTPLPFAYVVHLRRALILYCFTLPFALESRFGWWTIAVTTFIAYVLFGIEEIGVEIENPFGTDDNDLPLEEICARIDKDLGEIAASLAAVPESR
jgi:putative membrane protein